MPNAEMGPFFEFTPDPDNPGWLVRPAVTMGRFFDIFGSVWIKVESDHVVRMRIIPGDQHRNIMGTLHGGFIMALVDQSLFFGPAALGVEGAIRGSTIDTATQFFAPLVIGKPLETVIEVLRVTRQMIFVRGLMEQDGINAVSFSGTVKKARPAS